MSHLRIGIVGCGRMGRERARCVRALGASVTALYDVDAGRARAAAEEYHTRAAASPEDLFRADLDALMICVAPGARGTLEMECVSHGIPFLVEKPIGISAGVCSDLLSRLAAQPMIHAVGYMNRFRRSVRRAREILRASSVIGLSAHWVCRPYRVPWWKDERLSGGPHNEQATHLFDLARFLLGEVTEVHSLFHGDSQAASIVQFATGIGGTLFYSCDGKEKDIGLRIFTREGSLALTGWDFQLTENGITGELVNPESEDIFLVETQAFLAAVLTKQLDPLASDVFDAAATQRVLDAARRSGELRKPIAVARDWREVAYAD